MKHKPKYVIEYVALRCLAGVVRVLPVRAALILAWAFAGIAYYGVRFRVREAKARIREVFGHRFSSREVDHIAWISLRNTFFNAIDVILLPKLNRRRVEETTECDEAVRKVKRIVEEAGGGILCIPHMGSWDRAGVSIHLFDLPMFFLVGKQHNKLVDAYTNRLRGATGIETIPRGDSTLLRRVIRNLKQGKVLAFMTDLRSKTKGVSVRFLGKEANVVAGMALFARQASVPVIPAVVTRVGWGCHRWHVGNAVVSDRSVAKESDFRRMTEEVMDQFEAAIRKEPEQYFWYNKRWVLTPFVEPEPVPEPGVESAGELADNHVTPEVS